MKRVGIAFLWVLVIGLLASSARAVNNDSPSSDAANPSDALNASSGQTPYSAIWVRNVFDLKPRLDPTTNIVKTNDPPPNVRLTGIMTIFGQAQALFLVQEPGIPGKPPGKELSYMLSVGDRRDSLEVLDINPKACTVKIKNDGVESTITFETNKPAGGGQISAPGNPGFPGGGIPIQRSPGARPLGFPGSPGSPVERPVRSASSPQGGYSPVTPQAGYAQPGYQGGYAQAVPSTASATAAGTGLNLGALFNAPQSVPATQTPQPAFATPEEAVAVALANQVPHAQDIQAGKWPMLPTLPGVPNPGVPTSENQSDSGAATSSGFPPMPTRMTPPALGARSTGSLSGAQ